MHHLNESGTLILEEGEKIPLLKSPMFLQFCIWLLSNGNEYLGLEIHGHAKNMLQNYFFGKIQRYCLDSDLKGTQYIQYIETAIKKGDILIQAFFKNSPIENLSDDFKKTFSTFFKALNDSLKPK